MHSNNKCPDPVGISGVDPGLDLEAQKTCVRSN